MPPNDYEPNCKTLLRAMIHGRAKISDTVNRLPSDTGKLHDVRIFAANIIDILIEVVVGILEKIMEAKGENDTIAPPPDKAPKN